ncbi:hypothetical protein ETN89_13450 [Photobacterium damselae subsp. damselae]|uniref:phasin-related domain-containing protein n=1 Tax=Photobacterium damselae TaxID=38293 RepID=UPI000A2FA494|nr:phasin family protein [Photobacterium damselae]ARR49223.1 hypothetical protein CAY62_06320 [Photobacterium damselae subsp. damselae]QAY36225.1 hypothetical protein ETN89_13450 [Photobacterium damselae subsp. damselae]
MAIFTKSTSDKKDKAGVRDTMVHNIWLAGLGAYAKSSEEVNQLSDKGKTLFDELIERGKAVESHTKERVHTAKSQTSVVLEERVHKVVQKLIGLDNDRLDQVDDKIDQLTASIEALVAKKEKEVAPKRAGRKAKAEASAKPATRGRKAGIARRKTEKTEVVAAKPVPKVEPVTEKAAELAKKVEVVATNTVTEVKNAVTQTEQNKPQEPMKS